MPKKPKNPIFWGKWGLESQKWLKRAKKVGFFDHFFQISTQKSQNTKKSPMKMGTNRVKLAFFGKIGKNNFGLLGSPNFLKS